VQEASQGDSDAAAQRLASLKDVPILEVTEAAESFAKRLLAQIPLPAKAAIDALHISLAVVHNMDYLLTWNCAHIANAALRGQIEAVCRADGQEAPVICTPEELLED